MLQEVMTLDLMEVANTLVKLYLGHGKIVAYLDVICTEEIQNTSMFICFSYTCKIYTQRHV